MCRHVCEGNIIQQWFQNILLKQNIVLLYYTIVKTLYLNVLILFSLLQEYFKIQPDSFRPEDVFVCESRYSAKTKSFKKIKMWTMPLSSVKFVSREVPLPVVRVASMFAPKQDSEKPPEVAEDGKAVPLIIDKVRHILAYIEYIYIYMHMLPDHQSVSSGERGCYHGGQ